MAYWFGWISMKNRKHVSGWRDINEDKKARVRLAPVNRVGSMKNHLHVSGWRDILRP